MSVLEFIDSGDFEPVFDSKLPLIKSDSIDSIARALSFAIKNNDSIMVYGDYDADGLYSVLCWKEVFEYLNYNNSIFFQYRERTHAIDRNLVKQIREKKPKYVLICDTGSSRDDRLTLSYITSEGCTPLIIDHHNFEGDYLKDQPCAMYNSYMERDDLGGATISAGYSCVLVANYLCNIYFGKPIPFQACVYGLASMYSDYMDMSSDVGRALYNIVATGNTDQTPSVLITLNDWKYKLSRRFFSFIVSPKINACFRGQHYSVLNQLIGSNYGQLREVSKSLSVVQSQASGLIKNMSSQFAKESFGSIDLYTFSVSNTVYASDVKNYSGVIATSFASNTKRPTIVLIRMSHDWRGSFRDSMNRLALDKFKLICECNGHQSAFGLTVEDMSTFRKYLKILGKTFNEEVVRKDCILSSTVIEDVDDLCALALHNEYHNISDRVLIHCKIDKLIPIRSTRYNTTYDIGLPLNVKCPSLAHNQVVYLEPCITSEVALRLSM